CKMLNINNHKDKAEMMNYHRAKDMINLLTYFPDISPVTNLTIVKTPEDYLANYEFCKNLPCERNDTLLTKPSMKSIEGRGINPDIISIFNKVKEVDPDGVMILFDLNHAPTERYQRYAGISVGVSLGVGVHIEAVGRGFDGREITKGISCHERYFIPWLDLRTCNIKTFKNYRTYLISNEDYKLSRDERIKFLTSIGLDYELVSTSIPKSYEDIPDFIWLDIIRNILGKLEKMEEELRSVGLSEFAISGHTEGKRFLPWQMFDKSRYTLN
ncbi:MAG: hypothetical protein K2J20_03000, partial [Bacilli bacterium]|nr:hypothetical protein [Bacilli bacterium]